MRQRLQKLQQSVDRLNVRERLFVLAAALVVLGGLWEALLAAPLERRERAATERIATLTTNLDRLNESIAVTAGGMSEGMPHELDRLEALRARVMEGDEAVRVYTSDLIDPKQMRLVLEELIRRQSGLTLVKATNLEVRPLFEEPAPEDAAQAAGDAPKLYRHTLVLTLRGRFLDCLAYLEAVERLPWHLYWARLDFATDEYPLNTVVLELHTLSLEEEWIGV
jgi:MSHA biogenesis protein MshJ